MNTVNEEWKPIVGYEGLYEISNLGRVKSLNYHRTGVEKIMRQQKERNGYLRVQLWRDGKGKMFSVHRLVAEAFINNPFGFTEINHKDENKANNIVSNIEWASRSYNINYGSRNKKVSAALTNHPAKSKHVEASKYEDFRTIELSFASINEAKRNGYSLGNISACCNKCFHYEGNNKYRGLYWRFAV